MKMAGGLRIALIGMHLESNAFAPPTQEADFRRLCHLEGAAIVAEMRKAAPAMPLEFPGFDAEMKRLGVDWIPVPILVAAAEPGGPAEQDFVDACRAKIVAGLKTAGHIDGVYLSNHGAMVATVDLDPDGTLYAAIRDTIGAVPFVASVDLHANLSARMIGAVDAFVSYRTNPHVDQRARGAECARHLVELARGARGHTALVRLPLTPASVTLLTATGPYADLMRAAEDAMAADTDLMNLSVAGGFVFSDTPDNGLAVVASSRRDKAHANEAALALALQAWAMRHRFVRELTSVADAVALARAAADGRHAPVILADVGDNPGGGGRGNTTELLQAMLAAGLRRALFGNFVDGDLVSQAHRAGAGATFDAVFNRTGADMFAACFTHRARVAALTDGNVVGTRGIFAGRALELGPTAALEMGGVTLVAATNRKQCADPVFFAMHGLDPAAAACIAVKSRGHFRAGFDHLFAPENTIEVDAGGLTAPVLGRFAFRHLPRPSFPLDPAAEWRG